MACNGTALLFIKSRRKWDVYAGDEKQATSRQQPTDIHTYKNIIKMYLISTHEVLGSI
jgi:hypothetical protein